MVLVQGLFDTFWTALGLTDALTVGCPDASVSRTGLSRRVDNLDQVGQGIWFLI